MQLIFENTKERREVNYYADKLCLSPEYLAHIIKSFSDKPISYWINKALIIQAKLYLLDETLSIQQISSLMNFSDQSSFGRFFKKHNGTSPAQYRKKIKL
ncbi:MAG: helix-turn-helix domain-containing protein [Candidatus Cryptobacteroides sp.]